MLQLKSLIVGGLVPAILLGAGSVLMKLSLRAGSSVPNYLAQVGAAVLLIGLCASALNGGWVSTYKASTFALTMGVAWASAIGLMAYAVSVLQVPVSILSPLTNTNALVAVTFSAIIFKEWQSLDMTKVLTGTMLIAAGAYVVATAQIKS